MYVRLGGSLFRHDDLSSDRASPSQQPVREQLGEHQGVPGTGATSQITWSRSRQRAATGAAHADLNQQLEQLRVVAGLARYGFRQQV